MQITIQPSAKGGTLQAPASKSAMQRACAAALLHKGTTIIQNPGRCNDDLAAVEVIQKLGASVDWQHQQLVVKSRGVQPVAGEMNCGESGLGIRMFTPLAALASQPILITGSGSLVNRPLNFFDEVLPQLGVQVQSNGGKLPLRIRGPLVPADIAIDGSLSSQFLTGLLMAFGWAATAPVTIAVHQLKSKPYIDVTLGVMRHFGCRVQHDNYERFVIEPAPAAPAEMMYTVEGDWSGAAFLLVAGAVAAPVTVKGLDVFSAQADKAILQALMAAEARLSVTETEITVAGGVLKSFQFDATDCPDLFPPLVALAAYCDGVSAVKGISRLAHKESNRALTLQEEFEKMGVGIALKDDWMLITGTGRVKGAQVHSRHDHRIAMACAVAALKAEGPVTIEEAEAVNKSYPAFWEDLKKIC